MTNIASKLETTANVSIIVVAVLIGAIFISRYVVSSPTTQGSPTPTIPVGSKVVFPGVDWNNSSGTLVLALSTACRYCTDSLPFYKKLSESAARQSGIKLVAAFPQSVEESTIYLKDKGVSVDLVLNRQPNDLNVAGTPTLILVDERGAVVNSWVGKLPPEKEAEVVESMLETLKN